MMAKTVCISIFILAAAQCITIDIPVCTAHPSPTLKPFFNTVSGQPEHQTSETSAHVCHDQKYLHIYWWCFDDEIISTYDKCNDPLYNQDAVEIFLATTNSFPNLYYEFEVSPKGQLFFANIMNPNLTCSNLGTEYKPCEAVFYEASQSPQNNKWEAHLRVDLTIVGRGSIPKALKGNIFRIDKSTKRPTKYLALNPTLTTPACFHRPTAFVDMILS